MSNPSIENVIKEFRSFKKITSKESDNIINPETGEISTYIKETKRIDQIDVGKFFKMFHDSEEAYMKLNLPGYRLLGYISYRLKEGQSEVSIDPNDAAKVCGWNSRTMFYNALKNLYDNGFLYEHPDTHKHYINVKYFFNGVRTKLVRYTFNEPANIDGIKVRKVMFAEIEEPMEEKE